MVVFCIIDNNGERVVMKINIALLSAMFGIGAVFASDVVWTGADETNPTDWFAPSNWDGGVLPADGDSVIINSGSSIILSNSTPNLASIDVTGTLSFTNWMTRLNATTVTINEGGILTCEGPFLTTDMSNRVWVACQDFTLNAGGKVDVNLKGYGYPTDVGVKNSLSAVGPGASTKGTGGGAHGGYGGYKWYGIGTIYGSVNEPESPGSTGMSNNSDAIYNTKYSVKGVPAGGVVRIDATGIVTLKSSITANGAESHATGGYGAASGGSILIFSKKIVADGGTLEAKGGNQGRSRSDYMPSGGGGRIAVHYNVEEQSLDDLSSLIVSAAAGTTYTNKNGAKRGLAAEDFLDSADIGTIWFSDEKFLKFLGTSLTGQIYLGSGNSYSCDSLTMTKGWVRFAQEGFNLEVKEDVTLNGLDARLEIGGGVYYCKGYFYHHQSGLTPWSFNVGGDVSILDGARLDLYASATNGVVSSGGTLAITGDFTIDSTSKIYLSSDAQNGGAPCVTAQNVMIEEGAIVSANYRGFAEGFGPGKGYSMDGSTSNVKKKNADLQIGAGHGGLGHIGKSTVTTRGLKYDDPVRPTLPGSGGSIKYVTDASPLSGGGVIHFVAAKSMVVNGNLTANAVANITVSKDGTDTFYNRFGAASGGSILLEGKTVSIGETAMLSANGSNIRQETGVFYNAGVSGGGCIAIWTGYPYVEGETASWRIKATDKKPSEYLGSFSVTGGLWKWNKANGYAYGGKLLQPGEKIGVVIENDVEVDYGDQVAEEETFYHAPFAHANIRAEDGTIMFVYVESGDGLTVIVK